MGSRAGKGILMVRWRDRVKQRCGGNEDGQILLLGLGYVVVILLLLLVVVTLSAVHREHRELGRLADGVVLSAQDVVTEGRYYRKSGAQMTADARVAATQYLASVDARPGTRIVDLTVDANGSIHATIQRSTSHPVMVGLGRLASGKATLTASASASPIG